MIFTISKLHQILLDIHDQYLKWVLVEVVLIVNHQVNINSKLNMKKINHNLHKNNLKLRLTYVYMGNNDLPIYISINF